MKRFLALIIIAVTIIPLFAFPISAEEKHEIVLYENGQYNMLFTESLSNEEDLNFFINLLVSHTEAPYDRNVVAQNENLILFSSGNLANSEYNNKIIYSRRSIIISYDSPESRSILFNKLAAKIQSLPKDKIVIDETFFDLVKEPDWGNAGEETKEEKKEKEDNEGGFFKNAGKVFLAIVNFFDFFEMDSENVGDTLTSGGFNLIEPEGELNEMIKKIYNVLYPIGFITMLLCWGFGIAKSTISSSLDIKDKSSIIYSILSLILGVSAMSLSPQILTFLTGASRQLCEKIGSAEVACISEEYFKQTNFLDMIIGGAEMGVTTLLVVLFVDLIFMVNILWIALLQCLSPIFIGLMANQGTRKMSFNFIKEYFKALLIPVVTVCYWCLVATFQADFNNFGTGTGIIAGLLGSIVLAISTLSIAGKKLDKLIN